MRLWDKNLIFIWSGCHFQQCLGLGWGQWLDSQVITFCKVIFSCGGNLTRLVCHHAEKFSVNKSCQCTVPSVHYRAQVEKDLAQCYSWLKQETTPKFSLQDLGKGGAMCWTETLSPAQAVFEHSWFGHFCSPCHPCTDSCLKEIQAARCHPQDLHAPWNHVGDPSQEFQCPYLLPISPSWWQTLLICYIFKSIYVPSQPSFSSSTSITVFPQNLSVPHYCCSLSVSF